MPKTICIIGAFDTKGEDHAFLRDQILKRGHQTLTINIGVLGSTTLFPVDYQSEDVAKAGGFNLAELRSNKDKAAAMKAFDEAAPKLVLQLFREGKLDGIIGMGGSGGSAIIASAMRALPIGIPKVLVSTVASGDVSFYVRGKDITMMPVDRGRGGTQSHFEAGLCARRRSDLRNGRNRGSCLGAGSPHHYRLDVRQHYRVRESLCENSE